MDIPAMVELFSTLGFPVACVIVLAVFIFHIYKNTTAENKALQERNRQREEKLYTEIAKTREINAKAVETIAKYAEKLDVIQSDIHDIKNDIVILSTKVD